ncbi:MAG: helix-turn-helix transcriptional regulator [Reichenbachiella sp.]|uniref:helix-turn-helix domain-containing protein n=1 Tax=Reichenbachiella sp. TaxID=2184521 RepID=UPI003265C551
MRKSTKTKTGPDQEDIEAGKRLKALRNRRKLSQEKLGKYLDKSFQQIQKYENGMNKMSGRTIYRVSKYFGVPMEFFFDYSYKFNDNKLTVKAMLNLGSQEFENIEESLKIQFTKHIDWMFDAIEAGIKFKFDQPMANAHYMDIRHVSTKRIILMNNKIMQRLSKGMNDN